MARARKPVNKPNSGLSPELKIMGFVGALIAIGIVYAMSADNATQNDAGSDTTGAQANAEVTMEAYSTGAAAHGDVDAKAVLVKYTDFQ